MRECDISGMAITTEIYYMERGGREEWATVTLKLQMS